MDAATTIRRAQMSRMEIFEGASEKECICGGKWFQCATQVPVNNGIHPFVFADRVRNLRPENTDTIITGPANCGKTFLL